MKCGIDVYVDFFLNFDCEQEGEPWNFSLLIGGLDGLGWFLVVKLDDDGLVSVLISSYREGTEQVEEGYTRVVLF